MGVTCCKQCRKKEIELDIHSGDRASSLFDDPSEPGPDLEQQFLDILKEIPISNEAIKRKLAQLPIFEFSSARNCSALAVRKNLEMIQDEIYFGFMYITYKYSDPIQNTKEYKGVILYKNGGYYIGGFLQGKPSGKGRKITPELTIYEGDFRNGYEEGNGKCNFENGASYEGEWKSGRQNGFGIEDVPSSHHYEGEFKNGKKSGKGTIILFELKYLQS